MKLARLALWALYRATVDEAAGWGLEVPRERRVALIRIDGIGDFVIWLGIAAALRERYPAPDHRIILIAERSYASLAERLPYFDEVWPVDYRKFFLNPLYRFRVLRRVRQGGFSTAINLMHTRLGIGGRGGLLGGDALVRASRAGERIGSTGDALRPGLFNRLVADKIYTRLIPVSPPTESEFHRNADFLRGMGIDTGVLAFPELPVLEDDLSNPWDGLHGDYVVLIPGALADLRRWPIANFAEIARRVYERSGWSIVACGAPSETHLGAALEGNPEVPIRNLVGRTTLSGLVTLLANARLVISNETAAAHLAAAVRTPVACLLGGGHYGRFVPYPEGFHGGGAAPLPIVQPMDCFGCDWHCIYPVAKGSPTPCVERISVDAAWGIVEPLIESLIQNAVVASGEGCDAQRD